MEYSVRKFGEYTIVNTEKIDDEFLNQTELQSLIFDLEALIDDLKEGLND